MLTLQALTKFKSWFILAGSTLFSLFLWGSNLKAKWGFLDDHEIIRFLGPSGNVSITGLPALLSATELANPGTSPRYRPSYWLLRIMETFLWGDSPFLWYACRIVLFALSVAIVWWLLDRYLGFLASLLFTAYIFSLPFWTDIWTRLGPAETYAVFGCALYVLGFARVGEAWREGDRLRVNALSNWLIMLVGSFIVLGAKENMLFLMVPILILPGLLWKKNVLSATASIASALMAGYGVFVATAVTMAMTRSGKDIYANDTGVGGRIELLASGVERAINNQVLICLALYLAVLFSLSVHLLLARKGTLKPLLKQGLNFFTLSALLMMLYVTQFLFYNGDWPSENFGRYNFPGLLVYPFFLLIAFHFSLKAIATVFPGIGTEKWSRVALSVLGFVLVYSSDIPKLREAAQARSQNTQAITAFVSSLSQTLHGDPQSSLFLMSSNVVVDTEPITSVATFLRANKVKNPIHAVVNMRSPQNMTNARSEIGAKMILNMINIQNNGSRDALAFSAPGKNDSHACYKVEFSGAGPDSRGCTSLMTIMPGGD
ncbi:hypothetical protein [Geobacter sp. DSM 9736]|uniref:hypothetical protein n=1 Tax=Geobacter sp. DSM 9736 TaxID=1277350 RepID=UPI000B50F90F|nr:hypothetical protein [Geobacter sp. DSM 9736]SNB46594.1 hypothetical protein SAMN06269301_2062 [Geobacter sp. DSM 9736]